MNVVKKTVCEKISAALIATIIFIAQWGKIDQNGNKNTEIYESDCTSTNLVSKLFFEVI